MLSRTLHRSVHPTWKTLTHHTWTWAGAEAKHFTRVSHRKISILAASYQSDKRGQKTPVHVLAPHNNTQQAATSGVAARCARTRAKPVPGSIPPRTSASPPRNTAKQGILPRLLKHEQLFHPRLSHHLLVFIHHSTSHHSTYFKLHVPGLKDRSLKSEGWPEFPYAANPASHGVPRQWHQQLRWHRQRRKDLPGAQRGNLWRSQKENPVISTSGPPC